MPLIGQDRPDARRQLGDELDVLADLSAVMRDASICGLGQTAASAVESAMMNLGVLVPQ